VNNVLTASFIVVPVVPPAAETSSRYDNASASNAGAELLGVGVGVIVEVGVILGVGVTVLVGVILGVGV